MDKPFALIIDDDRDIVALFRHVLDLAGYRTEIVLHGKAAVERLATTRPDIVLLDLNLPGVPGTEVLHMIRTQEHLKGAQVVVITAYSHIAQTLEEEPDLVLLKPVNIEQLINLVERLRPTERRMEESPLDETTGFYNLSFFKSHLDYSLARLKQLDLSHFTVLLTEWVPCETKENGAGRGEDLRMVQEMARLLKAILRPTDTIAHLEGAKFAILIEDVRHWDIPIMLANRILARVGALQEGGMTRSQVNVGIILCHVGYANIEEIMRDAEASLALAKAEGKSCYKFYAQDNSNNAYDIDMIADMISIAGVAPLTNRLAGRQRGIQVRRLEKTAPKIRLLV